MLFITSASMDFQIFTHGVKRCFLSPLQQKKPSQENVKRNFTVTADPGSTKQTARTVGRDYLASVPFCSTFVPLWISTSYRLDILTYFYRYYIYNSLTNDVGHLVFKMLYRGPDTLGHLLEVVFTCPVMRSLARKSPPDPFL